MSETNTTGQQSNQQQGHCGGDKQRHHRRRSFGKALMVALAVFGLTACGHGWHDGGLAAFMSDKPVDTEQMSKFADKRLQHMLGEVKASDAQKTKASEIAKAAVAKGAPLAEKMRDNHQQLGKLMFAATLDKNAIETLRAEQMRLADEVSKLAMQTMQDISELLTPEQRAKLAEKMENRHGWMHHS